MAGPLVRLETPTPIVHFRSSGCPRSTHQIIETAEKLLPAGTCRRRWRRHSGARQARASTRLCGKGEATWKAPGAQVSSLQWGGMKTSHMQSLIYQLALAESETVLTFSM